MGNLNSVINNKNGLELGPLEAGHSYMLQNVGINSFNFHRGNSNSFLKCLVAKEILNLNRVNFYLVICRVLQGKQQTI